jgi:hypothetical protein
MQEVVKLIDIMSEQRITYITPQQPIKSLFSERFMRIRNFTLPFQG